MPEGGGDGERAAETERERAAEVGTTGCPTKEERAAHDRASIALHPRSGYNFATISFTFPYV